MAVEELEHDDRLPASAFTPVALLPIARHRQSLLYAVETYPVVVLVGQTGSGKTTQMPQFLYKAGWCSDGKCIAITQPRRVAATSVAARVAEEVGCKLGEQVGYSIRFEDVTSDKTAIKFLTDGLLLREALVDPLLSRYSVIMIDEAHERSLSSDILLGLVKKILKKRPELRVIISSATIQAEPFLDYFCLAHTQQVDHVKDESENKTGIIVSLDGRSFPVDILHMAKPTEDYVQQAVQTVLEIHSQEGPGDILVFLTGRNEIHEAVDAINERAAEMGVEYGNLQVMALYAGLDHEQQMAIFEQADEGVRRVIVATNIAEASVTVKDIGFVVDCGFVKLRAYNPSSGIEALTATAISKAAAVQRAGRAGRTRAGKCFRLYTQQAFDHMAETTPAEIQRSNLAPMILQLKALGIDNIARFDFLTPPPTELAIRALETLYALGALDDYSKLTRPLGLRMAELSIEPMMACTLLKAADFGLVHEMLTISAMTSLQGAIWIQHEGAKKPAESARRKFAVEEGDHITMLKLFHAFVAKGRNESSSWCRDNHVSHQSLTKAISIRNQLGRYLERFGIDVSEGLKSEYTAGGQDKAEQICRCLTSGYFEHAAKMQPDGSFKSVNGMTLFAHPTSLLFNRKAEWVIFRQVVQSGGKVYIKDISKIQRAWLLEYAPRFYQEK